MDHTAFLESEEMHESVCFPPISTINAAFQGEPISDVRGVNSNVFGKPGLPYFDFAYAYSTLQNPLALGPGVPCKSNGATLTPQKRFLIFDKSGNHTRLFISPLMAHQNEIITPKIPTSACGKLAAQIDQQSLAKTTMEEKWDENHLSDVEGDILDDTEEINALLCSDTDYTSSDGIDTDSDGENDEVTSKVQVSISIREKVNENGLLEMDEEVASYDGSGKRRKLLDCNYKKPSQMKSASLQKDSFGYGSDKESSYAGAGNCYRIDAIKGENNGKIHESLKILETIIPGLKSNNPLDIIDKAIIYLKSLRAEASNLPSSQVQTGQISEELCLQTESTALV